MSTATPTVDVSRPPALNVAARLVEMARRMPDRPAVIVPRGRAADGRRQYAQFTFRQLDEDSDRIAHGLEQRGVTAGTRLALLVRPSFEFVSLVFALLKAGAVQILVDPGMGRRHMIGCLSDARPEGFVAIPAAHAVRVLLRRRFPESRIHLTVGRRWFWGGATLDELRRAAWPGTRVAATRPNDPAAIIFTSGSTGVPKGVLYTHQVFDQQVEQIRDHYGIEPGEIDLPCFPLFALFNAAMGVTAVLPDMDPTRPAQVDPPKLIEAIHDWKITQSFGSPAVWRRVGPYCREHAIRLPTLRRVLSAGAPVPAPVLDVMRACLPPDAELHTPYGATEALPVASISAREVLGAGHAEGTAPTTAEGGGICVGRRFSGIEWRVVPIVDGPIDRLSDVQPLPLATPGPAAVLGGSVGELLVSGPVVTAAYVTRADVNRLAKVPDGPGFWHRMGDVGYLDPEGRFWFCGRLSQRVVTASGTLFTIPCEAIFTRHPAVSRSALVGVGGSEPGTVEPVIIVEPHRGSMPRNAPELVRLTEELLELGRSSPLTIAVQRVLFHPAFPVDVRHNAKIFREKLAAWAAAQLGRQPAAIEPEAVLR